MFYTFRQIPCVFPDRKNKLPNCPFFLCRDNIFFHPWLVLGTQILNVETIDSKNLVTTVRKHQILSEEPSKSRSFECFALWNSRKNIL